MNVVQCPFMYTVMTLGCHHHSDAVLLAVVAVCLSHCLSYCLGLPPSNQLFYSDCVCGPGSQTKPDLMGKAARRYAPGARLYFDVGPGGCFWM